jgi:hypothetical protein
MTTEMLEACQYSCVSPGIISEGLLEELRIGVDALENIGDIGAIRHIYSKFKDANCIKSHLAVLFKKKFSTLSKILSDPEHGTRVVGRPRMLTEAQEAEVVEFIKSCQESGHAATFRDATNFINNTLLEDSDVKVSDRFVSKNTNIMAHFDVASPQLVEELRVVACTYTNFVDFFANLETELASYAYDRDLIINVDETSTHAEKTKKKFKVLFVPNSAMRPVTTYEGLKEHITMCCGVSVSGKKTMPTFIIKNKTASAEQALKTTSFDHGNYALQYSVNGWQDTVIHICHK